MIITHRSQGQALVETALSLTVFLLLTMGVVDAARAAWTYNTVSFLARDGARYGVIPGHDVNQYLAGVPGDPGKPGRCSQLGFAECSVSVTPSNANCGALQKVTVSDDFTPATPLISALWGAHLTLSATSQMYVERGQGCP